MDLTLLFELKRTPDDNRLCVFRLFLCCLPLKPDFRQIRRMIERRAGVDRRLGSSDVRNSIRSVAAL